MLRRYQDNQQELEVLFGLVESLRITVLEERQPVFPILFLKLPNKSRSGISRIQRPSPTSRASPGRRRPTTTRTKEAT